MATFKMADQSNDEIEMRSRIDDDGDFRVEFRRPGMEDWEMLLYIASHDESLRRCVVSSWSAVDADDKIIVARGD